MTDRADTQPDFRYVPMELIDPPEFAMRERMDPDKLAELSESIKQHGMLQPGGLLPVGDRFRIIWGHRRFVACQMAGEIRYPALIHLDGATHEEDFKLAENSLREDVNPAEEATWLADLLERKCNGEIERLCTLVRRRESWVQGRLDLLRGADDVFDALRGARINLAVARELNKMKNERYRSHRLADAIEQGATAANVQRWRIEDERFLSIQAAEADGTAPIVAASTAAPLTQTTTCPFCDLDDDQHDMEYVQVHRSCHTQQRRQLRASRRSA